MFREGICLAPGWERVKETSVTGWEMAQKEKCFCKRRSLRRRKDIFLVSKGL